MVFGAGQVKREAAPSLPNPRLDVALGRRGCDLILGPADDRIARIQIWRGPAWVPVALVSPDVGFWHDSEGTANSPYRLACYPDGQAAPGNVAGIEGFDDQPVVLPTRRLNARPKPARMPRAAVLSAVALAGLAGALFFVNAKFRL